MRSICADPGMPAKTTIFRWLADPDTAFDLFRDQYARAREMQGESYADETVDIADDGSNDFVERERVKKNGETTTEIVFDREHVQRSALRVDARKWAAAQLNPKKYSPKLRQEHTGADGKPLQTGPTYIIDRREAEQVGEKLDAEV